MNNKITYELLPHQKKFLQSTSKIVCMVCGRGAGKSFVASLKAAICLQQGLRIIVMAQNYKALSENLMNEIVNRLYEMGISFSYNKGNMSITTTNGGKLYGISYESIESCRGFTEISVAILDEIALAPANLFSTLTFCMRGKGIEPKIYTMTTPRVTSWFNRFIKDNKNEIDIITAKTSDNIYITDEQIELMRSTVKDPEMMRQEFDGEILEGVSNLSLAKIIKNWEWCASNTNPYQVVVGIDPSGFGNDKTSICIRDNKHIYGFWYCDDGQVGNVSTTLYLALRSIGNPKVQCVFIDAGYGKEIYDNLSNQYSCMKVNFGAPSKDKAYLNTRAEMYFSMCYKLSYLSFNDEASMNKVKEEIESIEYLYSGENKIRLIPKDQIREVLGRSPDTTDSLALTFYEDVDLVEHESTPIRNRLGNPED
jgi:hypothetical protein